MPPKKKNKELDDLDIVYIDAPATGSAERVERLHRYELDREHALRRRDEMEFAETKEVYDFIVDGKEIYFSHLLRDAERSNGANLVANGNADSFRKLAMVPPPDNFAYKRRRGQFKKMLHWGQLKLFLSEVEFLTKVYQQRTEDLPIICVYAGAAPGHHIYFLHTLFPDITFELYDPNPFTIKIPGRDVVARERIRTHQQFFTNEIASAYADQTAAYTVFISDIRTEPATTENIRQNMSMQLEWWRLMRPHLTMFKFRLPWEPGQTVYPDGDIYLQAFQGATSTETRLIFKRDAADKVYDNKIYEDALYYHNVHGRTKYYDFQMGDLDLERDHVDNCYDCVSFLYIMSQYIQTIKSNHYGELTRDSLFAAVKDVQRSITYGRDDLVSKTATSFNDSLKIFRRYVYVPCGNEQCDVCRGDEFVRKGYKVSRAQHHDTVKINEIKIGGSNIRNILRNHGKLR
jgi:hypothetical protein